MIARWRQCTLNAGERVGCSGRMSPHKRGSSGPEISPFVCVFSYSASEQTDRNVLNVTLDPSPCHPCTDQYALTGGVSEIVCVSSQGGALRHTGDLCGFPSFLLFAGKPGRSKLPAFPVHPRPVSVSPVVMLLVQGETAKNDSFQKRYWLVFLAIVFRFFHEEDFHFLTYPCFRNKHPPRIAAGSDFFVDHIICLKGHGKWFHSGYNATTKYICLGAIVIL